MQLCAYHGDLCALKLLLSKGETLQSFGEDMGLEAAAFHGHWQPAEIGALLPCLLMAGPTSRCKRLQFLATSRPPQRALARRVANASRWIRSCAAPFLS